MREPPEVAVRMAEIMSEMIGEARSIRAGPPALERNNFIDTQRFIGGLKQLEELAFVLGDVNLFSIREMYRDFSARMDSLPPWANPDDRVKRMAEVLMDAGQLQHHLGMAIREYNQGPGRDPKMYRPRYAGESYADMSGSSRESYSSIGGWYPGKMFKQRK